MATVIKMPRLSDTMTEGVIKAWNKKVGDSVKPGDVLAEVETDKATMDLEAYEDGYLLHIAIAQGSVPVDGIIAVIGKQNEAFEHLLSNASNGTPAPVASPDIKEKISEPATPILQATAAEADSRTKVSPLAKSMARDLGIDLQNITGSGDQGRIVKKTLNKPKSSQNNRPCLRLPLLPLNASIVNWN